jgi:hypothetical protein
VAVKAKPQEPREPSRPDPDADLLATFPSGHVIFAEGDAGREMYIVESGQVEIVRRVHGRRSERLALLEAGDFFGEMSLLEGRSRSATARCLSETRLLAIDAATFDRILRQYPEVTIRVLRSLSARLRAYEDASQHAREVAAGVLAGVEERSAVMTPVAVDETAAPTAQLVHAKSGNALPLSPQMATVIGRFDPSTGVHVDVDLQPVDPKRSVSRIHARIVHRDDRYFLCEEIGTANGTWVGGERLAAGKEHEIRSGDRLRLGRVDLVFEDLARAR